MKDRDYEKRYRGDDPTSRLISVIWRLFFISVIFAFGLGFLASRYYQSPSAQSIPERTATPPARQASPSQSTGLTEEANPNSGEARPLPNPERLDSGQGSDESRRPQTISFPYPRI
jgi:hypothetical protein